MAVLPWILSIRLVGIGFTWFLLFVEEDTLMTVSAWLALGMDGETHQCLFSTLLALGMED